MGLGPSSLRHALARRWIAGLALLAIATTSCEPEDPTLTPEQAVRELVERMQRVHGDEDDARAAFELLSARTKLNLAARAERYSDASGKTMAPESMLVPSRFVLNFEAQEFTAEIVGAHALVSVVGLQPENRAKIPCIYEDGGWRVDLALPELTPIRMRPGTRTPLGVTPE